MHSIEITGLYLRRKGNRVIVSIERTNGKWHKVMDCGPDETTNCASVACLAMAVEDEELNRE